MHAEAMDVFRREILGTALLFSGFAAAVIVAPTAAAAPDCSPDDDFMAG